MAEKSNKQPVGAAADVQKILADERTRVAKILEFAGDTFFRDGAALKGFLDSDISAEGALVAMVKAQRQRQAKRAEDREAEAPKPLPSAPAAVSEEEGATVYEAATNAAVAEINAKRRGQKREGDEQQPE